MIFSYSLFEGILVTLFPDLWVQWNLHITDTYRTNFILRCREVSAGMEVSPFAIVYFGTKIFVRCSEVSVV